MKKKPIYEMAVPNSFLYVDPYTIEIGLYDDMEEAQMWEAKSILSVAHKNNRMASFYLEHGLIRPIEAVGKGK